jgi:hypothetical protein
MTNGLSSVSRVNHDGTARVDALLRSVKEGKEEEEEGEHRTRQ